MSFKRFLVATSAIALMLPFSAMAQSADPKAPVTHEEFSAMLKDALMKNPEMIVDAIKELQQKQKAQTAKEVEKAIDKNHDALFDASAPSIGDPKGDVTIVEFFDYHCGYCKHMLPVITQLNKDDSKVHIIFREFPILSEDSNTAAYAALAVNRLYPDKYFAFHTALMGTSSKFDDKSLSEIAKKLDLDWKKIKKEMDSPDIKAAIDKNRAMAEDIGIRGTPALIMGKQLMPGAVSYDDLKKMVANVRAGKPAMVDQDVGKPN